MINTLYFILISIFSVPLVTACVMRIKVRVCDSNRRMPTLVRTDTALLATTNTFAVLCVTFWGYYVPLEYAISIDFLLGTLFERWLLRVVYNVKSGPYHGSDPLAVQNLKRRYKINIALSFLVRSTCAAFATMASTRATAGVAWKTLACVVLMYVTNRVLLLDLAQTYNAGCREPGSVDVDATNDFVITDDDDDASQFDEHAVENPVCASNGAD